MGKAVPFERTFWYISGMALGVRSEVGEDLMDWHELADVRGFTALAEGGEGRLTRHVLALSAQRDAVTLQLWESLALLQDHTDPGEREFLADELAPGLGISPGSARTLLHTARQVAELPDLGEAMRRGEIGERHVHAALDVLRPGLDLEVREAVLHGVLARYREEAYRTGRSVWPTPAQLRRALRRALLAHRPAEAQERERVATEQRGVSVCPLPDGQAQLVVEGPAPQVLAMKERIDAAAAGQALPDDPRSPDARRFDAAHAMLTGAHAEVAADGAAHGGRLEGVVLVPLSTAQGGDLEPGDLAGYGPLLPQTCRDLLRVADSLRRAVVDPRTGALIVLDDPVDRRRDGLPESLASRGTGPVVPRDLSTDAYRPGRHLAAHVRLRDRTCVFPGCDRPGRYTDVDHRRPWPDGPTSSQNLQCLCRHHHRAKQVRFDVALLDDGSTVWTSRTTGLSYFRPPPDW